MGYTLHYDLIFFKANFKTNYVSYSGHLFFREMKKNIPKRWVDAREKAFKGSMLHFARSIYQDKVLEEGYVVSLLKRIPNPEKPSEDFIKAGQLRFRNTGNPDSLVYYNKLARLPDQIGLIIKDSISRNEIVQAVQAEKLQLQNQYLLHIQYFDEKESSQFSQRSFINARLPQAFQESIMQIPHGDTFIHPSGYMEEESNLTMEGYMGWEKLGEILPLNYQPPLRDNK